MFLLKGFKALRILMAMPEKTTSPAVLATVLSLASPPPSPGVELGSEDIDPGLGGIHTFGWGFGRVYLLCSSTSSQITYQPLFTVANLARKLGKILQ